jgi:hypothetical protein
MALSRRGSSLVSWVRSASIVTASTVSPATSMVPVTAVDRPTASFGLPREASCSLTR